MASNFYEHSSKPQDDFRAQPLTGGKQLPEKHISLPPRNVQSQPTSSKDKLGNVTYSTIQKHDTKGTHTYAHCSKCNLLLNYDVWGCGCSGPERKRFGIGGGSHSLERIIYTPGRCNHCAKWGQKPETMCEPSRCVKCIELSRGRVCVLNQSE
jgi:hypothetical protein